MWKARLFGLLDSPETDRSRAPKKAPASPQKKVLRPNPYQAVAVVHGSKCCAAVKALADQRFLARNAPSLPLAQCSLSDQCKCTFRKHDDRRHHERRLPGEMDKWYGGTEKRGGRGRRV